jgi:hypothetical protein
MGQAWAFIGQGRESLMKGKRSVQLTSLFYIHIRSATFHTKIYFSLYKMTDPNEEVNCTEPFPSVKIHWTKRGRISGETELSIDGGDIR